MQHDDDFFPGEEDSPATVTGAAAAVCSNSLVDDSTTISAESLLVMSFVLLLSSGAFSYPPRFPLFSLVAVVVGHRKGHDARGIQGKGFPQDTSLPVAACCPEFRSQEKGEIICSFCL
jgi:hypothetical protein